MSVTPEDRAHMQRIGRYEAEVRADDRARHAELSLLERLAHSLALSTPFLPRLKDDRGDAAALFYARARKLGLSRE